jgi:two-component system response regulator
MEVAGEAVNENKGYLPEVVLVEDNSDDEKLSMRAISQSGIDCHVTVLRDGAEALAYLLGNVPEPSLIILDYKLPKYNGLEILTRLRLNERTRVVPVVMFGGIYAQEVLPLLYEGGANSCVIKADDPKEYCSRLGGIVRYWLTVNTLPQLETEFALSSRHRSAV